jgi:hypothetical protein
MLEKTRSRSRIKRKKVATKDEKLHLAKIAAMPCCICGAQPVEVHHLRTQIGMGRRASHFQTLPLCLIHHRGPKGIHHLGSKAFERKYASELGLLEKVKSLLC